MHPFFRPMDFRHGSRVLFFYEKLKRIKLGVSLRCDSNRNPQQA